MEVVVMESTLVRVKRTQCRSDLGRQGCGGRPIAAFRGNVIMCNASAFLSA